MLPTGSLGPEVTAAPVRMCPQHPEPVPLAHPLPVLKEALEKVSGCVLVMKGRTCSLCRKWHSFIRHVIFEYLLCARHQGYGRKKILSCS